MKINQQINIAVRNNNKRINLLLKNIHNKSFQESIKTLNLYIYKKNNQKDITIHHKKIIKPHQYDKQYLINLINKQGKYGSFHYYVKSKSNNFLKNFIFIDQEQVEVFYFNFFHSLYPKKDKNELIKKAYNHIFWHEFGHVLDEGFNPTNNNRQLFKKGPENNLFNHLIENLKENKNSKNKNMEEKFLYSSLLDNFDYVGMESSAEILNKIIRLNFGENKQIVYEAMMENLYEMALFHSSLEPVGVRAHGSLMERSINSAIKNNRLRMVFNFDHFCYYALSELINYKPGYITGIELKEFSENLSRVNLGKLFWQIKDILQIWWPQTINSLKKYYKNIEDNRLPEFKKLNQLTKAIYGTRIDQVNIKEHDLEAILTYILKNDYWLRNYQKTINNEEYKTKNIKFCKEIRKIFKYDHVLGQLQPNQIEFFMTDKERRFLLSYARKTTV